MAINPLSLDFLTQKPGMAARVLQSLEAQESAIYLANDIPIRVVVPVIEKIESWPAARILERMPLDKSCAVLSLLKYPVVAAIMRLFDQQQRQLMVEHLPSQLVNALKRSLSHPEDTVGAWMDDSTPHFSRELTVGDCLEVLKKARQSFDLIVVIDDKHAIDGVISPSALLISAPQRKLKEITDSGCVALAANNSLPVAKKAEAWRRYNTLPVRDNNDIFAGTINRTALMSAMLMGQPARKTAPEDTLLAHLSSAMAATATGLLAITTSGMETARNGGNSDDRKR